VTRYGCDTRKKLNYATGAVFRPKIGHKTIQITNLGAPKSEDLKLVLV